MQALCLTKGYTIISNLHGRRMDSRHGIAVKGAAGISLKSTDLVRMKISDSAQTGAAITVLDAPLGLNGVLIADTFQTSGPGAAKKGPAVYVLAGPSFASKGNVLIKAQGARFESIATMFGAVVVEKLSPLVLKVQFKSSSFVNTKILSNG